jgi:hypothetical protein
MRLVTEPAQFQRPWDGGIQRVERSARFHHVIVRIVVNTCDEAIRSVSFDALIAFVTTRGRLVCALKGETRQAMFAWRHHRSYVGMRQERSDRFIQSGLIVYMWFNTLIKLARLDRGWSIVMSAVARRRNPFPTIAIAISICAHCHLL